MTRGVSLPTVTLLLLLSGLGVGLPNLEANAAAGGSGGAGFKCDRDYDAEVDRGRFWSAFANVRCTVPISRMIIEAELVQNGRQRGPTIDVDARDTNFAGDSFEHECPNRCRGSWTFQLTIIVVAPAGAHWTDWEPECRPVERYEPRQPYCAYYRDFVF